MSEFLFALGVQVLSFLLILGLDQGLKTWVPPLVRKFLWLAFLIKLLIPVGIPLTPVTLTDHEAPVPVINLIPPEPVPSPASVTAPSSVQAVPTVASTESQQTPFPWEILVLGGYLLGLAVLGAVRWEGTTGSLTW